MKKILLILFLLFLCPTWVQGDTKKISGTTNVEDCKLSSGLPNANYGGSEEIKVEEEFNIMLIRVKNVASELGVGATITDCVCSLYVKSGGLLGTPLVSAWRVFKPWVEGTQDGTTNPPGATWNDWDNDDYEWTTAGAQCANDDGVDNSSDDGACDASTRRDRKATAESQVECATDATWYGWDISNELAQGWYDGSIEEEGILLWIEENFLVAQFHSTENASNQPHFTFTYTTAAAGVDKPRKNIMSGGIVK